MLKKKTAVALSLALTLAFSAAVLAKSLLFAPRRELRIQTREVPESQIMTGRDEKGAAEREAMEALPSGRININTASAEELDRLPGIGPALSQAIVDYRGEHGAFKSPEDIMQVSGIGQGKFEDMKDLITIGE